MEGRKRNDDDSPSFEKRSRRSPDRHDLRRHESKDGNKRKRDVEGTDSETHKRVRRCSDRRDLPVYEFHESRYDRYKRKRLDEDTDSKGQKRFRRIYRHDSPVDESSISERHMESQKLSKPQNEDDSEKRSRRSSDRHDHRNDSADESKSKKLVQVTDSESQKQVRRSSNRHYSPVDDRHQSPYDRNKRKTLEEGTEFESRKRFRRNDCQDKRDWLVKVTDSESQKRLGRWRDSHDPSVDDKHSSYLGNKGKRVVEAADFNYLQKRLGRSCDPPVDNKHGSYIDVIKRGRHEEATDFKSQFSGRSGEQANEEEKKNLFDFDLKDQIEFIKTSVISDDKYECKKIGKHRDDHHNKLPIYAFKEELLEAIRDHQVIVIVGETGCGKSTQIPQYLHQAGYTKNGKMIGCTQPRRVAAMSVAARVSREMGVKLGNEVGYSIRFEDCQSKRTVIKYMTDGMLLREFVGEPDLAGYSVIMVDEAHERTISTDVLIGLLKSLVRRRKDLKLLISSASLDAVKFSDFFDLAPIFRIPGRRYEIEVLYTRNPVSFYVDAAAATVLQIHATEPPGDVLVFLTGQYEIHLLQRILKRRTRELGGKIDRLIICSIYANLESELQEKIFEPTPKGARKVVLATNIAETSLTIEGIKYVIDSGFCKISNYDHTKIMETLVVKPISKASALQRAGRSGRTGPGKCYRLYTADYYQKVLEENTVPEIQRTNMADVVFTLKSLGVSDLTSFDFMDPPPLESVLKAQQMLLDLGALNSNGELTETGRRMSLLPLDPMAAKMIVASEKFNCSEEIITIAAMLSVGNSILYRPNDIDGREKARQALKQFYVRDVGDHIALLKIYDSWRSSNFSTQWCYDNYIQVKSLRCAKNVREQLKSLLKRIGIKLTSSSTDFDSIKKAIISGYFFNIARVGSIGIYRTIKNPQMVIIHSSSSNHARDFPKFILYHELVRTSLNYMRQVSGVKSEWLLDIAPHYYNLTDFQDSDAQNIH